MTLLHTDYNWDDQGDKNCSVWLAVFHSIEMYKGIRRRSAFDNSELCSELDGRPERAEGLVRPRSFHPHP